MTDAPIGRPFEILLVEDNPGDVRLVQEALKNSEYHPNLTVAEDAIEALALLRHEGSHSTAPRPDLILLDLNLPKMSGGDFLAEIKSDVKLKAIPVVVLTVSQAESDVLAAYGLQASTFLTKPIDQQRFETMMTAVQAYWIGAARVPKT